MAMGQAAGIASALSIDGKVKVQNIDLSRLQDKLVDQKATLMYFKDVDYTSPHFRMVQYLGTSRLSSRMDCTFAGAGGYGDSNRLEKTERKGPAGHRSR